MGSTNRTESEPSITFQSKVSDCYNSRFSKGALITSIVIGTLAALIGALTICVLTPQFATTLSTLGPLGTIGMSGAIAMTAIGGALGILAVIALALKLKDSSTAKKNVETTQPDAMTPPEPKKVAKKKESELLERDKPCTITEPSPTIVTDILKLEEKDLPVVSGDKLGYLQQHFTKEKYPNSFTAFLAPKLEEGKCVIENDQPVMIVNFAYYTEVTYEVFGSKPNTPTQGFTHCFLRPDQTFSEFILYLTGQKPAAQASDISKTKTLGLKYVPFSSITK